MASICGSPVCAGGKPKLKFTYTGDYVVRKDGVVELRSSGTLVFLKPAVIDVFMVGGGGMGGVMTNPGISSGAGGGGGGYTATARKQSVSGSINVTIGQGATSQSHQSGKQYGGTTTFGSILSANGGESAYYTPQYEGTYALNGGAGGSGGGSQSGTGGENGGDGQTVEFGSYNSKGGAGQGATTREFGEENGKLYAGGGGGGVSQSAVVTPGGNGGGGSGGYKLTSGHSQTPTAGADNTGGGGGGGATITGSGPNGAYGGSGIVCFREAQELPELAGTWVLNERLYPSQTGEAINESINFTAATPNGNFNGVKISVGYIATSTIGFYLNQSTTFVVYSFSNNQWSDSTRAISQITFPAGATASDEFRAWLASNATKQA